MTGASGLPPEELLAERLRAGDDATFRMVLDAWSPSMLRLARTFVSTHASAEETVQDTWLAVVGGIGDFEARSSLKTWVFRILVNQAKTRGVRESRVLPFGDLLTEDEGPSVDPSRFREAGDPVAGGWRKERTPHPWPEPEQTLLAAEVRRTVGDAVAALPERHRAVIILRDVEGYAADEVCGMLDISPGNQRVLLHRARAAVRGRLEEYFAVAEEEDGFRQ